MVESVCSVERLIEVLNSHYSTIPVVNMYGSLIGLIPKSFVVVLIENHQWYELKKASDGMNISDKYQTIQTR